MTKHVSVASFELNWRFVRNYRKFIGFFVDTSWKPRVTSAISNRNSVQDKWNAKTKRLNDTFKCRSLKPLPLRKSYRNCEKKNVLRTRQTAITHGPGVERREAPTLSLTGASRKKITQTTPWWWSQSLRTKNKRNL